MAACSTATVTEKYIEAEPPSIACDSQALSTCEVQLAVCQAQPRVRKPNAALPATALYTNANLLPAPNPLRGRGGTLRLPADVRVQDRARRARAGAARLLEANRERERNKSSRKARGRPSRDVGERMLQAARLFKDRSRRRRGYDVTLRSTKGFERVWLETLRVARTIRVVAAASTRATP